MSVAENYQVHDTFFKKMMADAEVARSFIKNYLPKHLVGRIDLKKVELVNQSFVSRHDKFYMADVVLKVKLSKRTAYVSILIEHQRKPEKLMPLRIMNYVIQVMQTHAKQFPGKKLPLVYPVVFYNGHSPYPYSLAMKDLLDGPQDLIERYFLQPPQLVDLSTYSLEELDKKGISGLLGMCMGHHIAVAEIMPMVKLMFPQLQEDVLKSILVYVDRTKSGLESYISSADGHTILEGELMNFIERMEAKGFLQGKKQGIDLGQQRERIRIALNMLEQTNDLKFVSKSLGIEINELQALIKQEKQKDQNN